MFLIVVIDFVYSFHFSFTSAKKHTFKHSFQVHVGSYFPVTWQHKKKRDTFASAYRGVWHTLGIEWSKYTLICATLAIFAFLISNRQTFDKAEYC